MRGAGAGGQDQKTMLSSNEALSSKPTNQTLQQFQTSNLVTQEDDEEGSSGSRERLGAAEPKQNCNFAEDQR